MAIHSLGLRARPQTPVVFVARAVMFGVSALALAGCATSSRTSPIEVTRFTSPELTRASAPTSFFVIASDSGPNGSLALAPYKAAVANELAALGNTETSRTEAQQIVEVRFEEDVFGSGRSSGPVSVGVGGNAGSYGSNLGLGIGIDLSGGPKTTVTSQLAVTIRDQETKQSLWEGRAQMSRTGSASSTVPDPAADAANLARALFADFPGNNGETIRVGAQ